MLLKGLPESYRSFVIVHTQMDKIQTLTDLKSTLINYANTEALRNEHQGMAALASKVQPRTTSHHRSTGQQIRCNECGGRGHKHSQCTRKSNLTCTYCKKDGHSATVCFKKKADTKETTTTSMSTYAFGTTDHTLRASESVLRGDLLVDTGATSHMINDKRKFISFDTTFKPEQHYVEVADGRHSSDLVLARGNAEFEVIDSNGQIRKIILNDAQYAPDFPVNLFSVRSAVDRNAKVIFSHEKNRITAAGVHYDLKRKGNLYILPTAHTNAYLIKTIQQWHEDLGHMNYDDIRKLQSVTENMVISKSDPPKTCTTCKNNKMTRLPKSYDDKPVHATEPLQRVHSDINGPITPTSRIHFHSPHLLPTL